MSERGRGPIPYAVAAALALSGCAGLGGSDTALDRIVVVPRLPLQIPPVLSLPVPTPNGTNRADPAGAPSPRQDG